MNLNGFIRKLYFVVVLSIALSAGTAWGQDDAAVRASYTKTEQSITMRDGVKLFTSIYSPRNTAQKYPIMLNRTPYSVAPYGPDLYKTSVGSSPLFQNERFIFVYQDVRGKFMSEGEYENVRPHKAKKSGPTDIDESTDTYDTIEWLVKNVPNNNGRVGMWGISYPGFYVSMGIIDAHAALKAASPQAPIADWFIGDDFHHHGAFVLPHAFNFFSSFGLPRPQPTSDPPPRFDHGTPDGYKFFLDLGPHNTLVMGPWFHGGWARSEGDFLGNVTFGSKTSVHYRENVELPFFNCLLKDKCDRRLPEALVFETGSNQWRMYDHWPPTNAQTRSLYLEPEGKLSFDHPADRSSREFDEYVSDPAKPAPYINGIADGMTREYMVDDQRFAATRPDVMVYESPVLTENVAVTGPIVATLYVSTSGTDSDYIVKVIDVFPDGTPDPTPNPTGIKMGGYQMLVRGEPMRARLEIASKDPRQ